MSDQTSRREFLTGAAAATAAALANPLTPGIANASPVTIGRTTGSSFTTQGSVTLHQQKAEAKPLEYRAWADLTEAERFDIYWRYFTSEGRRLDQLEAAAALGHYDAETRFEKLLELLKETTHPGRQVDELQLHRWAFDDRRSTDRGACTPWLVESKEPHCPKCGSNAIHFDFYPKPETTSIGNSFGYTPAKTHDFWNCEHCDATSRLLDVEKLKELTLARVLALGNSYDEIENTLNTVMGKRRLHFVGHNRLKTSNPYSRQTDLHNWLASYTPLHGKSFLMPTFNFEHTKVGIAFGHPDLSYMTTEVELPEPISNFILEGFQKLVVAH